MQLYKSKKLLFLPENYSVLKINQIPVKYSKTGNDSNGNNLIIFSSYVLDSLGLKDATEAKYIVVLLLVCEPPSKGTLE